MAGPFSCGRQAEARASDGVAKTEVAELEEAMQGKRVTVIGGTGLIGKALVQGFRDAGAETIAVGSKSGDVQFDISCNDDSRMAQFLNETRPEVLVNCAYPKNHRHHLDGFMWTTLETAKWMKRCRVANVKLMDMATPKMGDGDRGEWEGLRNRVGGWDGGCIINYSSIYGIVAHDVRSYEGSPGMYDQEQWMTYSAVKGGILAVSRTLAAEYAPFGVRINCISPGGVMDKQPYSFVEKYCARVPLGRMARAEDLVGPTLFLAGEGARYVIGHNLVVDGGLTSW